MSRGEIRRKIRMKKEYLSFLKEIINIKKRKKIYIILVVTIFTQFIPPIILWEYKEILNLIERNNLAIVVLVTYEILQIIFLITSTLKEHLLLKFKYELNEDILKNIYVKMNKIRLEILEKIDIYNQLDRIDSSFSDDVVNSMVSIVDVGMSFVTLFIYVWMLCEIAWFLPWIIILVNIPIIYIEKRKNNEYFNINKELTFVERRKNYFTDLICNRDYIKDIKIYNITNFFIRKASETNRCITNKKIKVLYKHFCISIIENLIKYIPLIVGLFLIIKKINVGQSGIGNIVLYMNLFLLVQDELFEIVKFVKEKDNILLMLKEWKEFEGLEEENPGIERPVNYNIDLKNVSYKYPNSTDTCLKNINIQIIEGEKIAIVGQNGSGKTTLTKLILGIFSATEGEITIGSKKIEKISCKYREKIICLFQDFIKYFATINENITLGSGKIDKKMPLYNILQLEKIINKFSERGETLLGMLGGKGMDLSGGQWQKLALARALYQDSKVLILDEPTASFDPVMESQLYENLEMICENKTLLIVSHRMSACRICDRIIVLKNGNIVEDGTYEKLIDLHGEFYEMFMTQVNEY